MSETLNTTQNFRVNEEAVRAWRSAASFRDEYAGDGRFELSAPIKPAPSIRIVAAACIAEAMTPVDIVDSAAVSGA